MNTINIFDVQESVIAFAKANAHPQTKSYSGFYAGDGERWMKCADLEAAQESHLKYIFFVSGDTATIYQG